MSLLSRLLKPKAPETLESQLTRVASLDHPECLAIAQDAQQPNVLRIAAIEKLPFNASLLQLAVDEQTSAIEVAARKRLAKLLDEGELTLDTLAGLVPDQATLVALCNYATSVSNAVIERIDEEDILLDIAQNSPTTQLRQAAAERIQSREALESLQKVAKQKDKSVYKLVKNKLDQFKAAEAEQLRLHQEAEALCQQLQQLSKRNVDDVFYARLKQLDEQWLTLQSQTTEALEQTHAQARARCQEKIDEIETQQQAYEAQRAEERQLKQNLRTIQIALQQTLAQWLASPLPILEDNPWDSLLEQQHQALQAAQNQGLDTRKEQALAVDLQQAGERLQDQILHIGSLNAMCAKLAETTLDDQVEDLVQAMQGTLKVAQCLYDVEPPAIIGECQAQIKQYRDAQASEAQRRRKQYDDFTQLVRKGQWSIRNGHIGRSRAILRDVEALAAAIDVLPDHLNEKLAQLKADMEKLGDWHEFAVTPKKQALVHEMQALIASDQPLPERAKKVQKLQDGWRELCKGGQNQDADLWAQFQAATKEAYAPCKAYFAAQAQERDQNAERRTALIEQLKEYDQGYDWDQADWKEVEKTLRLAREAWLSYWPVPRKLIKTLQAEFDPILDRLYGRLHDRYEQNKQKKADIVQRAQALLEQQDIQQAIEQAKQLQIQWQNIGHCRRKDDQSLWKAFRGHCDQIFAKRQQENAAQQEERRAAQEEAETLLAKLEHILELQGAEFFTAKADMEQITTAFQNISELPQGRSKNLLQRYYDTLDKIRDKADSESRRAARQSWLDLLDLADQLRRFELTQIEQEDGAELRQHVEAAFDTQKKWPADTHTILDQRLQTAEQLEAGHLDQQAETLRLLCIRSEISNNLESPEADKSLRMAYQVQQLQQGIGQNASGAKENMEDILSEWLAVPAISDQQYLPLLLRLRQSWGLPTDGSQPTSLAPIAEDPAPIGDEDSLATEKKSV